ncbi:MAG: thiamine pyrophosphate-dependent dehydrogenase E1 component subunit alpha [Thermoplasmata archaeon]|nr:thiamine pyrophosphate-dependent dehydrogenase E1 component subunit alpha [Thermoplasmata archaeon]
MAQAAEAPEVTRPVLGSSFPESRIVEAYTAMVRTRSVDERCLTLQRQGRIGFYVPLQGQEAAQIGCATALAPEDWIFPAYRELGVALVRGIPIQLLLDQFIGNAGDELHGRQMPNHYGYRKYNFVTASSPVGTQISHAVGAAMAAQRRGDKIVTICFFGDGTTSSNDFHAGLNFAGVFQTPTIFFCQNNHWAISLPRERQTRSETLAVKGTAYGIPGVVVDGMDVRAVYRAVAEARERALAGGGPTLIEAQVYRLGPHSTSDDPRRYRTDAELAEWKEKDPIALLKHELLGSGTLSLAADEKIWESAKEEIAAALKQAEASPPVDPTTVFDDVFATVPPLLAQQRDEFQQLTREGVHKL